ncbi:hypothetical protein ACQY0O_003805 [Thecaphora frezii]
MSFFTQQQQQPQGGFTNQFSSPGPLSLNDLNKGQQSGGLFGQPSQQQAQQPNQQGALFSNSTFGQQQPQQQQPQQQQQTQPSFGGGFGTSSGGLFGSQNRLQQQQQPAQLSGFGQPLQQQQQQFTPQQQQTTTPFGQSQPGLFGQQPFGTQNQQQLPFPQQGQQQPSLEQQRMQLSQSSQQQVPQQQQQMSYVPGYLSRVRSDKPYRSPARQLEPGSPERAEAEASSGFGTPASKSAKDDASSSRNQSSPVGRFSSSFFNERRDDSDGLGRSGSVGPGAWRGGRESIFGAGGLRGGRKSMTPAPSSGGAMQAPDTPASRLAAGDTSFSPGRSFRAATSPPGRSSSFATGMDDDDDDAPPQEALDDAKPSSPGSAIYGNSSFAAFGASLNRSNTIDSGLRSSGNGGGGGGASGSLGGAGGAGGAVVSSASSGGTGGQLTGRAAAVDRAQRTVLIYGYPHWMEKAVLELFAAIGGVELIEAIDITGSGSAQDQAQTQPAGPFLPCCTRLVYEAGFQALHALRRNGEIVAGACIVGVRWEDENYHQISVTNGVDAVFRNDIVPSSRTRDVFKASAKPISIPSIASASGAALAAAGGGAQVSGFASGGSGGGGYATLQVGERSQQQLSSSPSNANLGSSIHNGGGGGGGGGSGAAAGSSSGAYGRPLSIVSGSSAIRPSASTAAGLAGSPFRVAGSLFGGNAAAGAASKPTDPSAAGASLPRDKSVMGRIADGIFGW